MFNSIKHLLPRAKAWSVTIVSKILRQFFEGIGNGLNGSRNFADLVWLDIFPATTREIPAWEAQFGIIDDGATSEADRRTRLDNAWKLYKINTQEQVEQALQDAGFSVYVHEFWVPGTEAAIGVHAAATVRNPNTYIVSPAYVLVNKIVTLAPDYTIRFGEPLSQFGETRAQFGEYITFKETPKEYPIPSDPTLWPYFIYIGGPVFGTLANVDAARREEFENLCLKICPCQHWLGMLVNYI